VGPDQIPGTSYRGSARLARADPAARPPLRFFDVTGNEAAETTFLGHRPPPVLGARNANLDNDE
jgi:hypothetical protein